MNQKNLKKIKKQFHIKCTKLKTFIRLHLVAGVRFELTPVGHEPNILPVYEPAFLLEFYLTIERNGTRTHNP